MTVKDLNKNFVSVKNNWDNLLSSSKETSINKVNLVCSEEYKNMVEKILNTSEIYFLPAYIPFEFSLLLNLFDRDASWVEYYNGKAIKISSKVRNYLTSHDQRNINDNPSLLYYSSKTLIGFIVLACVEEFKKPVLPKKEILLEGLLPFIDRLKNLKSKIPFEEKENCILASIMALLSSEFELSAQFLSYCKSFKEVNHHYSMLSQITDVLISDKKLSENRKVETAFFKTFNTYRLPVEIDKSQALGEYAIINNLVSNYLFAWLYLKLFKDKTETTWEEMRMIMMG